MGQKGVEKVSLVLLSSEDDATPYLREFHRRYRSKKGGDSSFHDGPIIRGEDVYRKMTRGKVMSSMAGNEVPKKSCMETASNC